MSASPTTAPTQRHAQEGTPAISRACVPKDTQESLVPDAARIRASPYRTAACSCAPSVPRSSGSSTPSGATCS